MSAIIIITYILHVKMSVKKKKSNCFIVDFEHWVIVDNFGARRIV